AVLLLVPGIVAAAEKQITVFVGEVRILQPGSVDRVAVGNGKLLSTTVLDNGQLLMLAEDAGETTMHLWLTNGREEDYKVVIVPRTHHPAPPLRGRAL